MPPIRLTEVAPEVMHSALARAVQPDAGSAATPVLNRRRWWVLAIVVAAQFMFVVDAFIVNVAIPAIRADLGISAAGIEAVIAIYQIAYATVVITGGRLGDIFGRRRLFLIGLSGFVVASLGCGLAGSGTQLIAGRLLQGAAAALMVPQVLATIHVLFPDAARARAFGVFGIALGLGGCTGFLLGGWLVTLDLMGLGWRSVFVVNLPVGLAIVLAALRWMPDLARQETRLDIPGAAVLFIGLLCLIGPLLFGRQAAWAPWVWAIMTTGVLILGGFLQLQRAVVRRGGLPLLDLGLLDDGTFRRRLAALFTFHLGNTSFYLVLTLFLQDGLGFSPLDGGLAVMPLGLAFVVASNRGGARPGTAGLIAGCEIQLAGLAGLAVLVAAVAAPGLAMLAAPLAVFGYGQGRVMAPLFARVLSEVPADRAGSASGMLSTVQQIAAALGISLAGLVYFAGLARGGPRTALLAALLALATTVFATLWLLRATPHPRPAGPRRTAGRAA